MILYYALGGGLGHISRSFALISRAPEEVRRRIRLLVSSKSAEIARPHSPCPMDGVPSWAVADRGLYGRFLAEYINRYPFTRMVIDTFPFGLLGELKNMAPALPRFLIGRYLRWDAYRERCGDITGAPWPKVALMLEEQDGAYLEETARRSVIINAPYPVSLVTGGDGKACTARPACAIIHSGPPDEMNRLREIAGGIMADRGISGEAEVFTPERGVFPMEHHLPRFSDMVTGGGYASCAAAALLLGRVRHHPHPFPRRFDDQALRIRRLREGSWVENTGGDASAVAALLWCELA